MDPTAELPEQVERNPSEKQLRANVGDEQKLEKSILELQDTLMVVRAKLKALAKPSCHKCHGQGYIGVSVATGALVPCRCYIKAYVKQLPKESAPSGTTLTFVADPIK